MEPETKLQTAIRMKAQTTARINESEIMERFYNRLMIAGTHKQQVATLLSKVQTQLKIERSLVEFLLIVETEEQEKSLDKKA